MPERWRPIDGYEGRYEVSDLGQVRSLFVAGRPRRRPLIMKADGNGHRGYLRVALTTPKGKTVRRRIHQLVLEAFVGPRPEGAGACHAPDPDKHNNRLSNLAWKTQQGNMDDRERNGNTARGERCGSSILTRERVLEIRASNERPADLARRHGVAPSTIWGVLSRRRWRHV